MGLRSLPPDPIRPSLTERNRSGLEHFKTKYDSEFAALADPQKREEWLSRRFEAQNRARQRHIYEWNEKHRPAKEQARRDMSLFRSLLDSKPFSDERTELTKLVSEMLLEDDLLQALRNPIRNGTHKHLGRQPITSNVAFKENKRGATSLMLPITVHPRQNGSRSKQ